MRGVVRETLVGRQGGLSSTVACMERIPFFDRFQLRAALLVLACLLPSCLSAGERISAYLDSDGRVVFINDTPVDTSNAASTTQAGPPVLDGMIHQAATEHQVDPELVRAVVQVESNFNPYAVSPKGAQGLMQLVPATARRFGVRNVFDPRANLDGGIRYLKYLMQLFNGDLRLTLAAYNAGENAVGRSGGVPTYPETQEYLRKISRLYPLSTMSGSRSVTSRIVRFVDSKGIAHFSNTDVP
ncbi:MAG: lytic transglycosylase domain-containing protein [Acidobacteria bacterium]|nr:lytic transglycosylase domain-containing protein [Acidobacteriota bacterium]